MMEDQSHHLRRAEVEELRKENEQLKKNLASAEWCRDYQAERRADKVEDIIVLRSALRLAKKALSIHGPCENHGCSECGQAWAAIREALAL